jgi:hypothetical protein
MELNNQEITSELIFPELEGQIGRVQNIFAANGEPTAPARVSFQSIERIVWTTTTWAAVEPEAQPELH